MTLLYSRHSLALVALAILFLSIDTWGHVTSSYHTTWWVDIVTHLLFGAWLALALLHPTLWRYSKTPLFIFTFVMLAGVGWEILEYLRDTLYAAPRGITLGQHGLGDSLKDIVNNSLGACGAFLAYHMHK